MQFITNFVLTSLLFEAQAAAPVGRVIDTADGDSLTVLDAPRMHLMVGPRASRWLVALLAWFWLLPAAALSIGDPPAQRFALPLAPEAATYDLARDGQGLLYVASEGEVLVFDGVRWEHIPTAGLLTRSLAPGPHGQIYVGGFDQIGVIERDSNGVLGYSAWTERLPAALRTGFDDVWEVRSNASHVYFRSLHHVFVFDHDGRYVKVWTAPDRFGALSLIGDELWLQWRGEGLKRRVGENFEMVPGGELFADTQIYHLWAHPQGGQVVLSQRPALQWLRDGKLSELPLLPPQAPPTALTTQATLASGVAVTGVKDGHLVELDFAGQQAHISGISSDFISGLVPEPNGDLWATDDEVLINVQAASPWRVLDAADGVRGSQSELRDIGGDWYGLSSAGLYVARDVAAGNPKFERIDLPITEAWSIEPDGSDLLVAESYALWRLPAAGTGAARPITDNRLYPRLLLAAKAVPRRLYIGTEDGVSVLDLANDPSLLGLPKIALGTWADSMVEVTPGRLFVGTQTDGLFDVSVAADASMTSAPLTANSGIRYGEDGVARVFRLGASVYAATRAGVFRWDEGRFVDDTLEGLSGLLEPAAIPMAVQGMDGRRWALSAGHAYLHDGDEWRELEPPARTGPALRSLHMLSDGQVVFGAASRLYLYEAERPPRPPMAPRIEWRRAWLEGDMQRTPLALGSDQPGILPARPTLGIQFAAPAVAGEAQVLFRQRVLGIDKHWSDWSPVAEARLGALPSGRMRLQVQARVGAGQPGPVRSLDWEVAPLWHESLQARLLLVGILLLIGGLVASAATRWRVNRLRARNDQLEQIVHTRTAALEHANVQLRAQSLRDGLTGIANRRAFDDTLREAWQQALRGHSSLALLMVDADHFKDYNDRYGHLHGDEVLRTLAQALGADDHADRSSARWGGEEFAILMTGTDLPNASAEAERVRQQIQKRAIGVTVSVGVAAMVPISGVAVTALMAAADGALYAAKAAGRNRVVAAEPAY